MRRGAGSVYHAQLWTSNPVLALNRLLPDRFAYRVIQSKRLIGQVVALVLAATACAAQKYIRAVNPLDVTRHNQLFSTTGATDILGARHCILHVY